MVVTSDSATSTEKEIITGWPYVEGTTLGTTKIHGKQINLVAEGVNGVSTTVSREQKKGV